jgi:hypothetical protein
VIITDGTTSLTFNGTRVDDFINIEKSRKVSAGGSIKSQTSGSRFAVIEELRLTGSEWDSLHALLTNGADTYYYTPTTTPDYMSSSDFPMSVFIDVPTKTRHVGGGTKRYYIRLRIEGVDYL